MQLPGFNFTLDETSRWTRSAACAEEGAPYMFPHEQDHKGIQAAKDTCAVCPVRALCLGEALDRGEGFGIWGGLTSDERRAMRRRAARKGITADDTAALDKTA